MDHHTQGLVLRLHPYSETSLIVRWLTPDLGRLSTIARGALRPKSSLRGRLDLCYHADISLTLSPRSTLHSLREVTLRHTFPRLRRNYPALQQAAYAVRLLEHLTEPDTPLPDLFPLIRGYLQILNELGESTLGVLALELRLLEWSGQSPAPNSLPESTRPLLEPLTRAPWDFALKLPVNEEALRRLNRHLHHLLVDESGVPHAIRNAATQWDPIRRP